MACSVNPLSLSQQIAPLQIKPIWIAFNNKLTRFNHPRRRWNNFCLLKTVCSKSSYFINLSQKYMLFAFIILTASLAEESEKIVVTLLNLVHIKYQHPSLHFYPLFNTDGHQIHPHLMYE